MGSPEDLRRGFKGKRLTWLVMQANQVRGWEVTKRREATNTGRYQEGKHVGTWRSVLQGSLGHTYTHTNTHGQHTPLSYPLKREGPGTSLHRLPRVPG